MSKFVFVPPTGSSRFESPLADEICKGIGIDPRYVQRIVLDLKVGDAGRIYVQAFADDSVLDVSLADLGIQITEEDA